jgi:hypothetical protein
MNEQVFARGVSASGDSWSLGWQSDELPGPGVTWLRITTPEGHTHKGGYGSPSIAAHSPVSVYTGSADHVPNGAILRVATGATSLEVTTSDGVTRSLELVPHPAHENALVAVLVYPPETTIRSVRVVDPWSARNVPITGAQVYPE